MEEILNKAFESGKRHEIRSGGCTKRTIAAVFEALGIKNDEVFRTATGFADGVGLTGDGHCGALSVASWRSAISSVGKKRTSAT